MSDPLEIRLLTPRRWMDFEQLFGERGACGGCWCMYWRLTRKQFQAQKGEGNRAAMKDLVESGTVPGLLGYLGGRPVAWCALAPREAYSSLARSRILKPVDDQPCWSVSCLFIERPQRRQGLSTQMLRAACEYARGQGARLLEGYPVEPKSGKPIPDAFAWTGIPRAFESAGFREVARRSPTRPIMRRDLIA
ncbi:MAG TPA: GNAT family N-acetyltransferase [Acidobacteriota bacterium]|nr:GNAT family N-acetyltransferase [Acidobacteriota bacterium]